MSEVQIIEKLKLEGYDPVYTWEAKPGEIDEEHQHNFETKLVVLDGEIQIKTVSDIIRDFRLKSGDEITIPKNQIHSAKVGPKSCRYVVAEKHT